MGFLKDGSISGTLPSADAFAIHYPGYPSSMEHAIETLGGAVGILKARRLQSNKLELHFRPEDPYSHPASGELQPCNNFLLKISKTKDRDGQNTKHSNRISESGPSAAPSEVEAQTPEDVEENLSADIVARVSEAYHFNGIVDYQHVLAVHADVARKKKRNWADVEPQFGAGGLMDLDEEDLMMLVPPLFSPKDVPEKVVLKPCVTLSLKKKQQAIVQQRWEMDIEPCLAIDFNIKENLHSRRLLLWFLFHLKYLPIPKEITWEEYIPKGSDQWVWQMAVCKLFDERPIWIKDSLCERLLDQGLKFVDHMLRRLLFRAAYYFSNGPFLRFWIKKGYDPRKDPESRIYQRIDFRVPPSLRSYCDANMVAGLKHRWEDICAFRVFPYKCQTTLQLFELADDYIQQEIRKPSIQQTCACATGWFSSRMLDSLRLCVAGRFLSVYPKAGAEALLKSARERFEKSRKMQMCTRDLKPDEESQRQVNRERVGDKDKEDPNDDDDDDEEDDEIEDGNVEEELDIYDALDLAGEDGSFSQQPSLYTDTDNISKNYLQMLFGSFPFNEEGGNQLQDADNSDGEYQIYEHFSDGNYSEDDDY